MSAAIADRVQERFATFDRDGDACVGVLSLGVAAPVARTGVVIVVGGPQYRAGSHRQFVALARALARAGFPTLRFDYRGMGDSDGERRTFEDVDDDIAGAVSALRAAAGVSDVVLWGLCDGASAALLYAARDPGVAGIVASNPWARSAQIAAATRVRHYYLRRIVSADFWRKALTGGVRIGRGAAELGASLRSAARATPGAGGYLGRMHAAWAAYKGPVLFVLSGNDFTAREFEAWVEQEPARQRLLKRAGVEIYRSDAADHTFSDARARDAVTHRTLEWIKRLPATS